VNTIYLLKNRGIFLEGLSIYQVHRKGVKYINFNIWWNAYLKSVPDICMSTNNFLQVDDS
jgi:hypothetical protein